VILKITKFCINHVNIYKVTKSGTHDLMSIGEELVQYILQTRLKKNSEDSKGGLPNATARVDSQLKLTFGQLVTCDKLTLVVGAGLGQGYGELAVF